VVAYEDVMSRPDDQLPRLAEFIGEPGAARLAGTRARAREFLDPRLYRSRAQQPGTEGRGKPASAALALAGRSYEALRRDEGGAAEEALELVERALALIEPQVYADSTRHREVLADIKATVPPETPFLLIDAESLGIGKDLDGRPRIPFPERNGEFCGNPVDDEAAVAELERQRLLGVSYVVVAWPALWWLDHYAGFARHLSTCHQQVLRNDHVAIYMISGALDGRCSERAIVGHNTD
jgi:hypothetical protein